MKYIIDKLCKYSSHKAKSDFWYWVYRKASYYKWEHYTYSQMLKFIKT